MVGPMALGLLVERLQLVLEEVRHQLLGELEGQLGPVVLLQLGLPEVPELLVLEVLEDIPVVLLPELLGELEEQLGLEERLRQ